MRTQRMIFLLIGILLAAAAPAAFVFWPTQSTINVENAKKIEAGMDLPAVERLLAGAARDESTGPVTPAFPADADEREQIFGQLFLHGAVTPFWDMLWKSDNAIVVIILEDNGRVAGRFVVPVRRVHENPIAMLRRWLRL